MKKRYDIEEFYTTAVKSITATEKETIYPSYFYKSLYSGDSKYYQKEEVSAKKFDDLWIKTIESYFPSINRITLNLKSTLKYQSEIIPIEKTKVINKQSVIHLMSHSNFVKEVTEEEVIPRQILSFLPEIEYGIYENRFIMTLIDRLRDFINRRLKIMRKEIKATKTVHLNVNSQMTFEESDFEVLVDIKQIQKLERRKVDEYNIRVLERAEKLFKLVTRLSNTQFMKMLRKFKPVSSPITKTQIILKNPDFKNAYLLWIYLDRYNELGYNLNITSKNKRFTGVYTKRINQSLLMMLTTLLASDKSDSIDSAINGKAVYKEKAAKTINKLPSEIDIEPFAYEMEDTGLNEYYLEKNKQILKKQFNELLEGGSNNKVALKKALADTLSITNALYESFFEINAAEDIFQQLIKEDDPEKMYKEAYDKYLIACSVREIKEQDFKKAIALEKKWQQQLIAKNKQAIAYKEESENKKTTDIIEELKKKHKDDLDICLAKNYREKQTLMRSHRMESEVLIKKLNEEYRQKKRKIVEENQKRLSQERERIRKQAKENKIKEEKQFKSSVAKLRKEHSQKMEQLVEQYKERYNKEKEKLIIESNEKIARQKKRIDDFALARKNKAQKILEQRADSARKRRQTRKTALQIDYNIKKSNQKNSLQQSAQKQITEYRQKNR